MMKLADIISEKNKGLWANIHAKKKRGEKSNPNSKEYKRAKAAGKKINRKESVIYRSKKLGLEIVEHSEPVIFQEAEYQGRKVELNKVKRGGDGGKFYVYTKKKYNITCERKFEVDKTKIVVGFTSKGCF